ncbi:Smr/MutS family protein [Marispirochaeta aestuarii]|uniref:Smr/MutS family protein n=1 Tax=Marispirochaeta aestuarii TaxID=1963862 RepID=UPI002ABE6FC2|nr:Smr/MutS family protein [Marispirochaeta aestuarii]
MNFGDILEQWEQQNSRDRGKKREQAAYEEVMNRWLEEKPLPLKDADRPLRGKKSPSRKTLRRMAPQESLDLHGYTVEEALKELDGFLLRSKRRGLRKVLIIHGKGNHSDTGDSILRKKVRRYIAESPVCGEHGVPQSGMGGEGAVWIILR